MFGTRAGSFAEYACAPQDQLAAKPGGVTFAQAAAVPDSGMAAVAGLRDAGKVQAGQAVLIIGAGGGVGTFAVQLAKAFGAHVTGVCSTTKADLVRSIGADDVVDYTRDDFADRAARYDLILDIAGNRSLSHLRGALNPAGTLVIVGGEGGGRWLGGTDRNLRAMALSPFVRQRLTAVFAKPSHQSLELLRALVEAGRITPVVDRTFPLREVSDAMRYLREDHVSGKVVMVEAEK